MMICRDLCPLREVCIYIVPVDKKVNRRKKVNRAERASQREMPTDQPLLITDVAPTYGRAEGEEKNLGSMNWGERIKRPAILYGDDLIISVDRILFDVSEIAESEGELIGMSEL
jgi:hypothetical protein